MSSMSSPSPVSPITEEVVQRVASKVDADGNGDDVKKEGDGNVIVEQKEFFWDQFLTYIATIIALLTVLDATLQFFRGGGLSCRVPNLVEGNDTVQPTRDEISFVNTFCQQSLSQAEYYPFFVLIQGLLLAAPQYLWSNLFAGQFDFFFGLTKQLDRLRDSKTGQYRSRNFEIVDKLEKHFPQNWHLLSIFSLYVVKLGAQFIVVLIAIIINASVFEKKHFSFAFKCPKDFNVESPPEGWWLPFNVTCVFTSFRLHQTIQNVNYLLLSFAFVAVLYGIIWCFFRHAKALGYREIALFAFNSCLRPEDYEQPTFSLFKPRILNDLDFLLLRLFQADSGSGNVFKDIQVERELRKERRKDHEYLYILNNAVKDSLRYMKKNWSRPETPAGQQAQRSPPSDQETPLPKQASQEQQQPSQQGTQEQEVSQQRDPQSKLLTVQESTEVVSAKSMAEEQSEAEEIDEKERHKRISKLKQKFLEAKFGENPGKYAYNRLGRGRLGSAKWEPDKGITDFIYGFFKQVTINRMALDISFGTTGYSLILARAFQEVVSLNFHPLYANEEEICRKDEFHTNYSTITFPESILSSGRDSLKKVDEAMRSLYTRDKGTHKESIRNNLVIIGPFTDDAKATTVNLFIERQQAAQRFDEGCIMLTVRPLKIGEKDVSSIFCQLVPQTDLFEALPMDDVKEKLKEDTDNKVQFKKVGEYEGIPIICYHTECIFEILVYKFCGSRIESNLPPTPLPPPPPQSTQSAAKPHQQLVLSQVPGRSPPRPKSKNIELEMENISKQQADGKDVI